MGANRLDPLVRFWRYIADDFDIGIFLITVFLFSLGLISGSIAKSFFDGVQGLLAFCLGIFANTLFWGFIKYRRQQEMDKRNADRLLKEIHD